MVQEIRMLEYSPQCWAVYLAAALKTDDIAARMDENTQVLLVSTLTKLLRFSIKLLDKLH